MYTFSYSIGKVLLGFDADWSIPVTIYIVFIFGLFMKIKLPTDFGLRFSSFKVPLIFVKIIGLLLLFLLFLLTYKSFGKSKMAMASDPLIGVYNSFFTIWIFILLLSGKMKKYRWILITLAMISMLFLGERNFIFQIAFIVFLKRFGTSNLKGIVLLCIFPLMLFIFSSSDLLKNLANRNAKSYDTASISMLQSFSSGEFYSIGRNMDRIVKENRELDLSIINDVARSLMPAFIFHVDNSVTSFNKVYWKDVYDSGGGRGFGLLIEFWVLFDYLGVFFLGLFLSAICSTGYSSYAGYSPIFLYYFPTLLFAFRGDLSYLISPFFKQIVLILLLLVFFKSIFSPSHEKITGYN